MKNTLRDIEELPDMGITLSDGTRLSARVWRPVDALDDPVPAILEYLPYFVPFLFTWCHNNILLKYLLIIYNNIIFLSIS